MNINFEKDWRGIIPTLSWGWILIEFPVIPKFLDIFTTDYNVDQKSGILIYRHGLINKRQENIDLYRVKNISSNENMFNGGHLYVTYADGSMKTLPYIRNANDISVQLRNIVNGKRAEQGVKPVEVMM